jgi:hypothetical protein
MVIGSHIKMCLCSNTLDFIHSLAAKTAVVEMKFSIKDTEFVDPRV